MTLARLIDRYRFLGLALAGSAALHAAVMVNVSSRVESLEDKDGVEYSATLDPMAQVAEPAPAPVVHPAPARPRTRRATPRIAPEVLAPMDEEAIAAAPMETPVEEPDIVAPPAPPKPEMLALAQPAVPLKALASPAFKADALPAELAIHYTLTSAMADGEAVYKWSRDGDKYRITGEAQAVGFFTLFLEGRVLQETTGTVTPQGLRPERFIERKPSTATEGLEFDWDAGKVTFDRNNEKRTDALGPNIIDWLSMLFQTAANPPPSSGDYDLNVLTQRKLYRFKLKVLGEEEIEIPMGKVRTLHLRHIDEKDATEIVDVWLGLEQSYLPVKLRYPVARNRLMVEQVATRVSTSR